MIRSALAIIFLMFLLLSDFAGAAEGDWFISNDPVPKDVYAKQTPASTTGVGAIEKLNQSGLTCQTRAALARKVCFESLNPDIQKAMPIISGLTAAAAGMVDSCSKFGDALKIANTALTAFNVACSAAKVACDTACSNTQSMIPPTLNSLDGLKSAAAASNNTTEVANLEKDLATLNSKTSSSVQVLASECQGHSKRLMAAAAGIMAVIAESKNANKCEEETSVVDCNTKPMDATCIAKIDCSLSENFTKTTCICAKSPTAAGCSGAGLAGGGDFQQITPDSGDFDPKTTASIDASSSGADMISPNGGGSASGGGGFGAAASGSGGGGIPGGSAQDKAGKSADGKSLNTNILSGYEGGGGGGGGRSGSGASGSEYDQYLPGGKKDPSRNVASQVFANGEVTGGGGKSNWEKVTDRYRDNRPKLMTGP